ncbi:hypothetical protein BC937DRAFT_95323, partial [Endogone sp. FLAS-F59071]
YCVLLYGHPCIHKDRAFENIPTLSICIPASSLSILPKCKPSVGASWGRWNALGHLADVDPAWLVQEAVSQPPLLIHTLLDIAIPTMVPAPEIQVVEQLLNNPAARPVDIAVSLRALSVSLEDNLTPERVLTTIPLPSFFNLFGIDDESLTQATCSVLEKLMRPWGWMDIASGETKEFLIQGLQHFSPDVRALALGQVAKCLESEEAVSNMVISDAFPLVLVSISFQNTGIANSVIDLVYKLALTPEGQRAFFSDLCYSVLSTVLRVNDIVKFRVYELAARIAGSSLEAFDKSEDMGLLDGVVGEVKSNDLLVKLNAVEMISQLATTQSGYDFLEKSGVVDELADVLRGEHSPDVTVTLVKCAALKFFGNLSGVQDVDFAAVQEKHAIFKQIGQHLDSRNLEAKVTTLAVIGLIGSTPRGLRLLHEQPARPRLLDDFVDSYRSAAGNVKIAALQALSNLLRVGESITPDVSTMTESLYRELPGNPTTIDSLIVYARSPVEDLRVAVFSVFQAIAERSWGRKELSGSKNFIDYILNRTTETTHGGKTWKFSIIQTLVTADDAEQTIDRPTLDRLTRYVQQGPFFVYTEAAVAMESA